MPMTTGELYWVATGFLPLGPHENVSGPVGPESFIHVVVFVDLTIAQRNRLIGSIGVRREFWWVYGTMNTPSKNPLYSLNAWLAQERECSSPVPTPANVDEVNGAKG